MKIISGLYKNRELLSPNSSKTHPMGSREKLALFNMLGFYLKNAEVLDAFSGSGALGLEALSRGAKKVIFVEKSPKVARIIKENCKTLKISPEAYEVIIKDINKNDISFLIVKLLEKYAPTNKRGGYCPYALPFVSLRMIPIATPSRDAPTNTITSGLEVISVQTSPTSEVMVLTPLVIVELPSISFLLLV